MLRLRELARAFVHNDIDRVEAICLSGLTATPDDEFLMGVLAEIYWRNGRHTQAYTMAKRALAVKPENFATLRIAAATCVELGKPDEAGTYAIEMLLNAPASERRIVKALIWLLFPVSWIPIVRKMRKKALEQRQADREWVVWASQLLEHSRGQ